MVVFELICYVTHLRERITGHFDAQNMDDEDEKGKEKDKKSQGVSTVIWKEIKERRRNLT